MRPFLHFVTTLLSALAGAMMAQGYTRNAGQLVDQNGSPNGAVMYILRTGASRIQLRANGYSYEQLRPAVQSSTVDPHRHLPRACSVEFNRIDIDFVDPLPSITIAAEQPTPEEENVYCAAGSFEHIRTFRKVVYKEVWRNTDVEFLTGPDGNLFKYNILLHPGARLSDVKLRVKGALPSATNDTLSLLAGAFSVTETLPRSWYSASPEEDVPVHILAEDGEITFDIEGGAKGPLVIDPSSGVAWATYVGGSSLDVSNAVSVSGSGVFMTGYTLSQANMATSGAWQGTCGGNIDVFVARFGTDGTRQWSTYFGGSGAEIGYAIAATPRSVFVSGDTYSQSGIASPGAHQTVYGGGIDDAFLARFSPSGQRLWSTYYGGSEHDIAQALAVDLSGSPVISGHTESPESSAIATPGAYNTSYNLNYDVFLAKFDSTGSRTWGTYYGENGVDETYALTIDSAGNVYAGGGTSSLAGISTGNVHQPSPGGSEDGFIAKFNAAGTALLWATYYGGSGDDFVSALALRGPGELFAGGATGSPNAIASAGANQAMPGGAGDAFLASFNGTVRTWATYVGGEEVDYVASLVARTHGIYLAGSTVSSGSISTTGAWQAANGGANNYDAYLCKYSSSGFKIAGTFFGGPSNDLCHGMAADAHGNIYLAGESTSSTGIATSGAFMSTPAGSSDAFLVRLCMLPVPDVIPAGNSTLCAGTISLYSTPGATSYLWNGTTPGMPVTFNAMAGSTYSFYVQTTDSGGCSGVSPTATITAIHCIDGLEATYAENARAYPNPFTGILTLDVVGGETAVESVDGREQRILHLQRGINALDLSELPNGVYIVRQNGAAPYKVVKTSD